MGLMGFLSYITLTWIVEAMAAANYVKRLEEKKEAVCSVVCFFCVALSPSHQLPLVVLFENRIIVKLKETSRN